MNFEEGNWKHISHEAKVIKKIPIFILKLRLTNKKIELKDLVKRMLNLDPRQRISSTNILKHPWITNADSLPDIKLAIQDGDNVKVSFCKFLFFSMVELVIIWLGYFVFF